MRAIIDVYRKFFEIKGRANRSQYIAFYAFTIIVSVALWFLAFFNNANGNGLEEPNLFLVWLWVLINIIPMTTLSIRRLHDMNKSGWWVLPFFVPYLGKIVFFILLVRPGTQGDNRFGPQP